MARGSDLAVLANAFALFVFVLFPSLDFCLFNAISLIEFSVYFVEEMNGKNQKGKAASEQQNARLVRSLVPISLNYYKIC